MGARKCYPLSSTIEYYEAEHTIFGDAYNDSEGVEELSWEATFKK